ncbi:hypothetical protein BC628DRAFT_571919 [Trametes gibbosa]|nr:hypothetical protein BC628DRAFT_571919 [Trametes gibbosa]
MTHAARGRMHQSLVHVKPDASLGLLWSSKPQAFVRPLRCAAIDLSPSASITPTLAHPTSWVMPPAKKRTKHAAKEVQSPSGVGDAESSTSQNPARAPRRKLRGRRGSLHLMPRVPLDVILEILFHLHPRDLLNLSQTSKEFRAFLLSRENAFVWKAARGALPGDLPDPDPFLSEPELANLMFFFSCHVSALTTVTTAPLGRLLTQRGGNWQKCGRGPVHKVIWLWFKRYCAVCLSQMTCLKGEVERRMPNIGMLVRIERCEWGAFLSVVNSRQYESSWNQNVNRCHAPQVDLLEQQCRDVFAAGGGVDEVHKFYQAQRARVKAAAELSEKLEDWSKGERQRRCVEEQRMKDKRFEDVLDRLRQAGWGLELDYRGREIRWDTDGPARDLYKGKPVAKLTDRAWPKVHQSLKGYMTAIREERTAPKTVLQKVDSAIGALYYIPDKPTAIDLAWMPEGETFFTNFVRDVSPVASLVTLWQARFRDQLSAQIVAICPSIPIGIDPLDLAVAVFGCKSCEARPKPAAVPPALRYPHLLSHECFRQHDRWVPDTWPLPIVHAYQQRLHDYELETSRRCPFVVERISMVAATRARAILTTLRRDANQTTAADMEEVGCKLMCIACPAEERLFMFDWSSSVRHDHRAADLIEMTSVEIQELCSHEEFRWYPDAFLAQP